MRTRVRIIERATGEVVEETVYTSRQTRDAFDFYWAAQGNWQDFYVEETDLEEEGEA